MRTRLAGFLVGLMVLLAQCSQLLAAEPEAASCGRCIPPSTITPVAPSRGAFIESHAVPCDDWLCHVNPEVCGPICDFWFSAEFLAWCMRDSDLPPLVTTSPAASGGVIGQAGTRILVGGGSLAQDEGFLGGRFTAGGWLDYHQHYGLEGQYFFLGERANEFSAASPGEGADPVLARPFVTTAGAESARLVPFNGFRNGAIFVRSASGLQGADLNFIWNQRCDCNCAYRLDLLLGLRFLQLTDELLIRETGEEIATSNDVFTEDAFATRSMFLGPQAGVSGEYRWGRWVGRGQFKLALGVSHYDIDIRGFTQTVTPAGTSTTATGGLLALATNIGKHDDDGFAVVPSLNLQLGYRVCEYATVTIGYDFLYWSNVVRAGGQVDRVVNTDLVPVGFPPPGASPDATPRPAYSGAHETGFWAHGLSFGLDVRY